LVLVICFYFTGDSKRVAFFILWIEVLSRIC